MRGEIEYIQKKFLASEMFLLPNKRSHPFCASADVASLLGPEPEPVNYPLLVTGGRSRKTP